MDRALAPRREPSAYLFSVTSPAVKRRCARKFYFGLLPCSTPTSSPDRPLESGIVRAPPERRLTTSVSCCLCSKILLNSRARWGGAGTNSTSHRAVFVRLKSGRSLQALIRP